MNELIEFLTSKEIIVVYIVAIVACALCFIIYLVDKNYYKRKQKHNTRELNRLVEKVNELMDDDEPVEVYETPVLETLEFDENITYTAKVEELEVQPEPEITIAIESKSIVNETNEVVVETLELEPLHVEDIVLETMVEETKPEVEEELSYTTVEPNRQQAQEELMRLTQELEKAEQEIKNIDLTTYEEEQEENAIISLEELVRKSKEMYESNELTQYADEGNEPISLEELEKRMNKVKEEVATLEIETLVIDEDIKETPIIIEQVVESVRQPEQMVLSDFNTIEVEPEVIPVIEEQKAEPVRLAYQSVKKFESSPVISPIYGIERRESKDAIELENTANYEKLDEEIKKTNEFLMTLKELQKNLD